MLNILGSANYSRGTEPATAAASKEAVAPKTIPRERPR
jgi:hypothetical protein